MTYVEKTRRVKFCATRFKTRAYINPLSCALLYSFLFTRTPSLSLAV
jgi:hypothetical protein